MGFKGGSWIRIQLQVRMCNLIVLCCIAVCTQKSLATGWLTPRLSRHAKRRQRSKKLVIKFPETPRFRTRLYSIILKRGKDVNILNESVVTHFKQNLVFA